MFHAIVSRFRIIRSSTPNKLLSSPTQNFLLRSHTPSKLLRSHTQKVLLTQPTPKGYHTQPPPHSLPTKLPAPHPTKCQKTPARHSGGQRGHPLGWCPHCPPTLDSVECPLGDTTLIQPNASNCAASSLMGTEGTLRDSPLLSPSF